MTPFDSLIDETQEIQSSGSTNRAVSALSRISDLFVAGAGRYSTQQIEMFDEIFKTFVSVIELKVRARLALQLATNPDAPAALLQAFAFDDDIAVAGPVLKQSTSLSESSLLVASATKSQRHLCAIAQRQAISELVTDVLIERGERDVVHAVAKNPGARISDSGFNGLVLRAADDAELAVHVGSRRDIPRHHLVILLETASAEVCEKIFAVNSQLVEAAKGEVTEVVDELGLEMRNESTDHAKAKKKVRRLKYWRELGEGKVHAAARAQDFEQVTLALSILARCPIEVAERAVLNENPGAVQVVAKAAGCSWATVKSLLLMRAAGRRLSKSDLDHARKNFEGIETETAQRVLEIQNSRREHRRLQALRSFRKSFQTQMQSRPICRNRALSVADR
jgi:uncharacterized protein (DUF2336 family)